MHIGFTQLIKEPTHMDGYTLGHVYVNIHQMELNVEVMNGISDISTDRYPIIIKLPQIEYEVNIDTITVRRLKNINMVNFKYELQ